MADAGTGPRSAGLYITLHQQGIRTLNTALPLFGAANVILSIAAAIFARGDSARFSLFLASALCFAAAGLITRLRNQRINATVIAWKSDAPPANWREVTGEWLWWHVTRLLVSLGGLSLMLVSVLRRG